MDCGLKVKSDWPIKGNRSLWGFALGAFNMNAGLRVNKNGEWTKHRELTIGERPPQKMMDLKVRRIPVNK